MDDKHKREDGLKDAEQPLDPQSGNASLDSEIHAATTIQSTVTPEDYPEGERGELGLVEGGGVEGDGGAAGENPAEGARKPQQSPDPKGASSEKPAEGPPEAG